MLDNIEVAILTKVNELAERYGLKTYDFVATIGPSLEGSGSILSFDVAAQGTPQKEENFAKMLKALGVTAGCVIQGSDASLINTLDNALQIKPRARLMT
jgi:hypothetical protein